VGSAFCLDLPDRWGADSRRFDSRPERRFGG